MKKCYHYFYSVNGFVPANKENTELMDIDSCFPDENSTYKDVIAMLDNQRFDISRSVVRKLVEFAASLV